MENDDTLHNRCQQTTLQLQTIVQPETVIGKMYIVYPAQSCMHHHHQVDTVHSY